MLSFKIQFIFRLCLLRMRVKMKPMINRLIQAFSRNVDDVDLMVDIWWVFFLLQAR